MLCLILLPALLLTDARADSEPVIRRILLDCEPIFTEADCQRFSWLPLAWVNRLHFDTQPSIIRRELVISEGQPARRELLDECERKLRQTGFFSEVWVDAVAVTADSVDVRVRTRELWTTSVNFSYEHFEQKSLWSASIRERNFLGRAQSFALGRSVDLDRSSWMLSMADYQLLRAPWQGSLFLSESDDGKALSWRIHHPFFSMDSNWSFLVDYQHQASRPRYYLDGSSYQRPHRDRTKMEVAVLRKWKKAEHGVWRYGTSFLLDHQRFNAENDLRVEGSSSLAGETLDFPASVAESRRLHTLALVLERRSLSYLRKRFLFAMGRVEDIPLGHEFRISMGVSPVAGEALTALYTRLDHQYFQQRSTGIRRLAVSGEGMICEGGEAHLRTRLLASYYSGLNKGFRLAYGLMIAGGRNMDRHNLYSLGVDSGLRAAQVQELSGDRILRWNTELRWTFLRGIWDMFTPGAAIFFDSGTAWLEGEEDFRWDRFHGAIGLGLRLGMNRASENLPIRVDWAWPMFYPPQRNAPVFSIGTGQVF